MLKVGGTFLHLENPRPHITSDEYAKFGIKKLPCHPCSPDLDPCDFWLFGYLKHCLEGQLFDDDIALEGAVSESMMSIEPDVCLRVFAEWKHRLQQCIDHGCDYL
jgi:hypothetical protein